MLGAVGPVDGADVKGARLRDDEERYPARGRRGAESTDREFRFGEGKISARISAALGVLGLGAVLCLLFPSLLTAREMRALYPMPWLRRLDSSGMLGWLASSRLHLVDILLTRAAGFVPLYVMGFAPQALYAYIVFASLQGIFIHASLRWRLGWLRHVPVTPQFHHGQHTAEADALDRHFAAQLPLVD